ncbi:MAG: 4Fe-4S binding protein [Armatimonadota bacterium]
MSNPQRHQPTHATAQRRLRILRFTVLLVILAISTTLGILHQLLPFGKAPVGVDALCPFGGIEAAYTLIATGQLLQRVAISSFILLVAVLVTALIFRRGFCGYICPLGTLQEIFSRLGRRMFKRTYRLPAVVDGPARWLKYLVLVVVVVGSAKAAELIIRPYDPWVAYHHLTSNEVWAEFPWGVGILAAVLLGSLLFNRVFCKYLCPMGAVLGAISWLSFTRVRRHAETCINCHRCDRVCPVDLQVSNKTEITSPECLDCHECVNSCPVADTLVVGKRRTGSLPARTVLAATLAIFVVAVGATSALRLFQWSTIPLPAQMAQSGKFDPAAIRGKMVFADVIAASGVPETAVMERFKLTREDLHTPIKDAAMKYGFEADDVREFIAAYLAGDTGDASDTAADASKTPSAFDAQSITGMMTMEDVAKASGISLDTLATHFAVSTADRRVPLKELKRRYPFDTQAVRDFVATHLNKR